MKTYEAGSLITIGIIVICLVTMVAARYFNNGQDSEIEKEAEEIIKFEIGHIDK